MTLLPSEWYTQGTPSIKFVVTHLYIWVERGTVRARALSLSRSQNARSGIDLCHTNYEAIAVPTEEFKPYNMYIKIFWCSVLLNL